jgi:GNAT superfamily N-acetyltransferase
MELIAAGALDAAALAATEEIYVGAFPEALRAPFADLLRDDTLALIDDARPVGLAVSRPLGPTGWVFLRYLAVAARGRGVGSQLWRHACDHWAGAGYSRVLLDVEDPDEDGIDPDEKALRQRRIVFYQRLGAALVPVHDFRPPQHDGVPHPLRLVTAGTGPGPVAAASVRDLVLAVYRYRYGLPADHPIVRRSLETGGADRAAG